MVNFFNSTFFNSIVVLVVGLLAFIIYRKQKCDRKQEAACIIVREVRQAEDLLTQMKDLIKLETIHLLSITPSLITTNSWEKYGYLFTKDLDFDEFTAISKFYKNCMLIDKCIDQLSFFSQLSKKNEAIIHTISQLAYETAKEQDAIGETEKHFELFQQKKNKYLNLINADATIIVSIDPLKKINDLISRTAFILTDSCSKLKKISK